MALHSFKKGNTIELVNLVRLGSSTLNIGKRGIVENVGQANVKVLFIEESGDFANVDFPHAVSEDYLKVVEPLSCELTADFAFKTKKTGGLHGNGKEYTILLNKKNVGRVEYSGNGAGYLSNIDHPEWDALINKALEMAKPHDFVKNSPLSVSEADALGMVMAFIDHGLGRIMSLSDYVAESMKVRNEVFGKVLN